MKLFIVDDVGRPETKPIVTSGVVINIAIINHDTAELIAKIKRLSDGRKKEMITFATLDHFFGLPEREIQSKLERGEKVTVEEANEMMAVIRELMAENHSLRRQILEAIGKINSIPQTKTNGNPRVTELEGFIRNVYELIVGFSWSDGNGPIQFDDVTLYDIRREYGDLKRTVHALRAKVRELEGTK